MTRAVLSLGSNLGDPWAHLTAAVRAIEPAPDAVSSVYRTPPWGPVPQDDFLNIVVVASDPGAEAADWLRRAQRLERAARRERPVRWGPRTLDVDVVAVVDERGSPVCSADPELTLPHPRAAERAFVLLPWTEVEPEAELPGLGRIADLLAGLDATGIERVGTIAR